MEWMLIYLNNLCECSILTRFILLLRKYSSFPGCQKQQFLFFSFFLFLFFFSFGNSSKVKYQNFGFSSHQNAVIYLSLYSSSVSFPPEVKKYFYLYFSSQKTFWWSAWWSGYLDLSTSVFKLSLVLYLYQRATLLCFIQSIPPKLLVLRFLIRGRGSAHAFGFLCCLIAYK